MARVELKDHILDWSENMRSRVRKIESTTAPGSDERLDVLLETHDYSRILRRVLVGEIQFVGVPGTRRRL